MPAPAGNLDQLPACLLQPDSMLGTPPTHACPLHATNATRALRAVQATWSCRPPPCCCSATCASTNQGSQSGRSKTTQRCGRWWRGLPGLLACLPACLPARPAGLSAGRHFGASQQTISGSRPLPPSALAHRDTQRLYCLSCRAPLCCTSHITTKYTTIQCAIQTIMAAARLSARQPVRDLLPPPPLLPRLAAAAPAPAAAARPAPPLLAAAAGVWQAKPLSPAAWQ